MTSSRTKEGARGADERRRELRLRHGPLQIGRQEDQEERSRSNRQHGPGYMIDAIHLLANAMAHLNNSLSANSRQPGFVSSGIAAGAPR